MARPLRKADCHPERAHLARNLCGPCYVRWWNSEKPGPRRAQQKRYRAANRAAHRAAQQRRRASASTSTANTPTAAQLAALTAPGVLCFYCEVAQADSVDHFIPLARGGLHELSNLVGACTPCNCSKGPKLPDDEWQGRK